MKSYISWKGVLISLSVLILFIGTYRLATGDIAFPNEFQSGQPAIASEVNANFAAINARQVASTTTLAGTYYIRDLEMTTAAGSNEMRTTCSTEFSGTLSLTEGGVASLSGTSYSLCDCNNCTRTSTPTGGSGNYSVGSDGSGTISAGGETVSFQASKDLNLLMFSLSGKNSMGMAIRQ
jgi:hypothetical protein